MFVTITQAFSRLLWISLVVIMGLFLSVFVTRQLGFSRIYPRLPSPLLDELAESHKMPPKVAVSTTGDGSWITGPFVSARNADISKPPLSWTSRGELPQPSSDVAEILNSSSTDAWMPLEFLLQQTHENLWINVVAGDRVTMAGFLELVLAQKADRRLIICSESSHLLAHIRKKQPLWPTCVSEAELALLDLMAGFYLEPAAPFSGEVVTQNQLKSLSERALLELSRRGILVLN